MGFFANLVNDPFKPSNGKWLFVGDSQTNKMATNYVAQLKNSVGFTNYKIIQNILDKRMDQFSNTEKEEQLTIPDHENIRGEEYYQ